MAMGVAFGLSPNDVAKLFGVNWSTIRYQVKRGVSSHHFRSKPRKGRPRFFSRHAKRRLHWLVKREPRNTWNQVRQSLGVACHVRTLRRAMQQHYHRKCKAMDIIPLISSVAKERLAFACYWLPRLEELELVGGGDCKGVAEANAR
jgi:hypothetical protein